MPARPTGAQARALHLPGRAVCCVTSAIPYAPRPLCSLVRTCLTNKILLASWAVPNQARWSKPSTVSWTCRKEQREWTDLWVNLASLWAPGAAACWADNFRLVNRPNGTSVDPPGVEVRVGSGEPFGALEPVLCLDPGLLCDETAYMKPLAERLEREAGLVPGKTLLAAPYDHRYATDALAGGNARFEEDLTALVERASAAAGGRGVALISHSLGGLVALHWLQGRPAEWKREMGLSWISLSTPFGGAAKEYRLLASGDADLVPGVSPLKVRSEQRTSEIEYWLLPSAAAFGDTAILTGPDGAQYTASDGDRKRLFQALKLGDGIAAVYERVSKLVDLETPPGVRLLAVAGAGVETEEAYDYRGTDFDTQPHRESGDGDGVVSSASLGLCQKWGNTTFVRVRGVDHTAVLQDTRVFAGILAELSGHSAAVA